MSSDKSIHDVVSAADDFNDIFQLDVDWLSDTQNRFSVEDIREFIRLSEEIIKKIDNPALTASIWTLTQSESLMRLAVADPNLLDDLRLSGADRDKLREEVLSGRYRGGIVTAIKSQYALDHMGPPSPEEISVILDAFFESERRLLADSGLNQSSVAVILQHLRGSEAAIRANLENYQSVLIGRYQQSLTAVGTFLRALRSAIKDLHDAHRPVRLSSLASLRRSKSKMVGLATLWGDAIPLITARDWGIASVISTTAGATVASILPTSGPKKSRHAAKNASRKKTR